jgi:hypothetical protein
MTAEFVKLEVARYFRYGRQFPIVAVEPGFSGFRNPDVLVMKADRLAWEIEVKVSLDDLRRDKEKASKHRYMELLHDGSSNSGQAPHWIASRFSFAVPHEIHAQAEEIIEERYPYAGLLSVYSRKPFLPKVWTERESARLHETPLDDRFFWIVVKAQSSTLVRYMDLAAKRAALIPVAEVCE